jgi:heme oxygenase (biliverdin-producing, ferredoxin)
MTTTATTAALTCSGTDPAEPLSVRLRTATAVQHTRAERSEFVETLLSGAGSATGYTMLLVQLRAVYEALESAADGLAGHPVGGAFVFPELRRLPSVEHDLRMLGSTPGTDLLPATIAYVQRLSTAGRTAEGYLAHAYTRYLGDLSGGQVIGRSVARHYGIPIAALTFYEFPEIPKPKVFKDLFRARIDAAPFDDAARDRVVAEAGTAFDLNTAVFVELAEKCSG